MHGDGEARTRTRRFGTASSVLLGAACLLLLALFACKRGKPGMSGTYSAKDGCSFIVEPSPGRVYPHPHPCSMSLTIAAATEQEASVSFDFADEGWGLSANCTGTGKHVGPDKLSVGAPKCTLRPTMNRCFPFAKTQPFVITSPAPGQAQADLKVELGRRMPGCSPQQNEMIRVEWSARYERTK
jgi:hypothetical protein